MPQMHRTAIHIPDALWRAVQDHAKREGISASQYIREAVRAVMAAEQGNNGPVRQRVKRRR